jgi:hypothetical protein
MARPSDFLSTSQILKCKQIALVLLHSLCPFPLRGGEEPNDGKFSRTKLQITKSVPRLRA